MPRVLLEACVETLPHALAAEAGGAGRIELCAALDTGGLTPPEALVAECVARLSIPVFVMIRARPGGFALRPGEVAALAERVRVLGGAGAAGFVLGAVTESREVDSGSVSALVQAAGTAPVTFHRAFDVLRNPAAALELLISLGVARVLSAGGTGTALDGAGRLAALVRQAAGRCTVVAGGGVRAQNAADLVARTGVTEIHSRTTDDAEAVRRLVRAANGG